MFYMHDIGWGWEFLMVIGMVAFWGFIVFGVLWLVRGGAGAVPQPPSSAPAERPIDILNRRLAMGELTLAEYQERREAIERDSSGDKTPV